MWDVPFGSSGARTLCLDLWRSEATAAHGTDASTPVVLWLHGGGAQSCPPVCRDAPPPYWAPNLAPSTNEKVVSGHTG